MAISQLDASVAADFDQIWSHYSLNINARLQEPQKAKRLLRAVHRFAVVTSIVRKSIPGQRLEHKRIFLREFASDEIHLMHVLLVSDTRAGYFYLSSAVENLWRHVYFKDHPVEYGWLFSDSKFYTSMDDLRKYCAKTEEIDARLIKSLERIAGGYQKLSRFVHGSKTSSLQLRNTLTDIQLSTKALSDIVSDLRSFGRDLILLPLVLHAADMERLHPREKRFALNYLDMPRKRLLLAVHS